MAPQFAFPVKASVLFGPKERRRSTMPEIARMFLAVALLFGTCWPPKSFAQAARANLSATYAGASVQMVSEGKILFRQRCASCHYAESTAQKIAVGMKGLYARRFSDGKKVTDAGLAQRIEAGGKDMPGFQESLKPEQVRALISYIKTL